MRFQGVSYVTHSCKDAMPMRDPQTFVQPNLELSKIMVMINNDKSYFISTIGRGCMQYSWALEFPYSNVSKTIWPGNILII